MEGGGEGAGDMSCIAVPKKASTSSTGNTEAGVIPESSSEWSNETSHFHPVNWVIGH